MIDDLLGALFDIPGSLGGGGKRRGPSPFELIARALTPMLALVALGMGVFFGLVIGFADGGHALVTRPGLLALPALLPLAVAIAAGAAPWRGLVAGAVALCICFLTAVGVAMLRLLSILNGF